MDDGVAYYRDGGELRTLGVLAPRDCGRIECRSPRVGLQPLVFRRGSGSVVVRPRCVWVFGCEDQRCCFAIGNGGRLAVGHTVLNDVGSDEHLDVPNSAGSAVQVSLKAPGLVLGVDGDGVVAIHAEPLVRLGGAFSRSFSFCDRNGTNSHALETPFCEAADPLSDTCSTRCGEPASPTAPHAMRAPSREYGLPRRRLGSWARAQCGARWGRGDCARWAWLGRRPPPLLSLTYYDRRGTFVVWSGPACHRLVEGRRER